MLSVASTLPSTSCSLEKDCAESVCDAIDLLRSHFWHHFLQSNPSLEGLGYFPADDEKLLVQFESTGEVLLIAEDNLSKLYARSIWEKAKTFHVTLFLCTQRWSQRDLTSLHVLVETLTNSTPSGWRFIKHCAPNLLEQGANVYNIYGSCPDDVGHIGSVF